jgi:hypothetical protein
MRVGVHPWLGRVAGRPAVRGQRSFRPRFELLEEREVPAVYLVTITTDGPNAPITGNGTAQNPFRGFTLRGALEDINTNHDTEANTIQLIGRRTYQLTQGQLTASLQPAGSLTIKAIRGGRATIQAVQQVDECPFRVIEIDDETTARLNKLVITGGLVEVKDDSVGDGGGGILNGGNLTLNNSVVTENRAFGTGDSKFGFIAFGGGIANQGELTLNRSAVTENDVSNSEIDDLPPLTFGFGGGIFNASELTLTNRSVVGSNTVESKFAAGGGIAHFSEQELSLTSSAVVGNRAQGVQTDPIEPNSKFSSVAIGGGIFDAGASTISIRTSTIADNIAHGGHALEPTSCDSAGWGIGGGLASGFFLEEGSALTIARSTFSGNQAIGGDTEFADAGLGLGGGLSVVDYSSFLMINSTVSGNLAQGGSSDEEGDGGGEGGGLYLSSCGCEETVSGGLVNVTITQNRALSSSGPGLGGGILNDGNPVAAWNTIIAQNYVTSDRNEAVSGSDVFGDFLSDGFLSGFNLIGNGDGSTGFGGPGSHDIVGSAANVIDARLKALAFNGGPTQTHALRGDSPALNGGDNDVLGAPFFLRTDQRGLPRKSGPRVDIGAFEVQIGGEPSAVIGRRWNR